ncbi:MAG: hypothetical protein ACE5RP_00225 [Nitrosopumilus sp.]
MRKSTKRMLSVFGILLLVVALGAGGYFGFKAIQDGTIELSPAGGDVRCDSDVTPDLTIRSFDVRNPGSSLTGYGSYRLSGQTIWTDFETGTTITSLQCGETYEFVIGANQSDSTDLEYGQSFTYVVQNKETDSVQKEMSQVEDESGLAITFYNADGDASAETFSAGQTQDVEIKFQASVDEFFGNPYGDALPNVICMNLNSSAWDKPEAVRFNGQDLSEITKPKRHSTVTGKDTYCYEAPVFDDGDNRVILKMNADDTNAPAYDETLSVYAGNWFYNAETGEVGFGVEDEEGNAVGVDSADTVTLDFTA